MYLKFIQRLNPYKSCGIDGVHSAILKNCSESLARPLALLFRLSLDMAQLSRQWRQANVTPLLKKGSLTDPAIYRPVSITTIPCKVLESILRDHIYNHLERNRLLSGSQHGFVKRKACTTNLLEHEDMVSGFLAQDEVLDIFYADFAKAFDTVSHRKLL